MVDAAVDLPAMAGGQAASWRALIEIAPTLSRNWLLVGGQMVFLHELERQSMDMRPTDDIDVVVDLRTEPTGLSRVHRVLSAAGFAQDVPGPDGTAHRYRRDAAVVDVLAPERLGARAQLRIGAGRTIEVPGTTQAFRRSGVVKVEMNGLSAEIRRPNLVGALIGKAAAVAKISSQSKASRSKHVRDVDALARLLGPADRSAASLTANERKLLRPLASGPELSPLGAAALQSLAAASAH